MKRRAFVVVVLVGAGILAGASQPVLKNKKPRIVSIKLEKELTLGEKPWGANGALSVDSLLQSR